jgi:hypothetical protein
MTREHRWHASEKVIVACCILAAVGNFYYVLLDGDRTNLYIGCFAAAALLFFLWRRPRTRGNQLMDAVIRRMRKEDRAD